MRSALLFSVAFLLTCDFAVAQALRPGRLSKEEQAALVPGLRLEFSRGEVKDARVSRLAALYVAKPDAPTPHFSPGAFQARFDGYVKVPLKGDYRFQAQYTGKLTVQINDEGYVVKSGEAFAVPLVKGFNKLSLEYISPGEADARLRLLWKGEEFPWEPLPPDALFTRGDEALLVSAQEKRAGRELFATRSCAKCHSLGDIPLTGKDGALPELKHEAPSLEGIGSRASEAWLRAWLQDPQKLRPSATMPQVLHGLAAEQDAADIAAWLATRHWHAIKPAREIDAEQAAEGLKLWENLGCIACHSFKPPEEEDAYARLSLHYAAAKYRPEQLGIYLRDPQQHYPWTKMPDFKPSFVEESALEAFIRSRSTGKLKIADDAPRGDAKRGEERFATAGCASCHRVIDEPPRAEKLLPLAAKIAAKGCLADKRDQRAAAPDFSFTAAERSALLAFLATDRTSLTRDTAAEFSLRQAKALNCIACHRRDGTSSVLALVLDEEGEQGLTPEILPLLTHTGEKLRPAWSERLLNGELDQRARPWLKARMPAFRAQAKLIALGLSHEHGFAAADDPRPAHDAELAKVGAGLTGDTSGFSCTKCHAVGDRAAIAPFEAPGINLASAAERLRYPYYQRWMLDPQRVDVLSKMQKFSPDGKTTGVTTILDGDAQRQNEALWHYLQTLK